MKPSYTLVDNQASFDVLCMTLASQNPSTIAIDFEFMRERTYYADLCLIQLGTDSDCWIIDPRCDFSLDPLWQWLHNSPTIKIFHAGYQDLEIIHTLTSRIPAPLFDTQIAAQALGLGEQISYQHLIAAILGVTIEKGARFSNWALRPLASHQLDYAAADVYWLLRAYPILITRLQQKNRLDWIKADHDILENPDSYRIDPNQLWRRIRFPSRKKDALGRLKALALWRDEEARRRNIPRSFVLKDETLCQLAAHPPANAQTLAKVRGFNPQWATNAVGKSVLDLLAHAPPLSPDEYNTPPSPIPVSSDALDLLKILLKHAADKAETIPRMLCTPNELALLASTGGDNLKIAALSLSVMTGWRYDMFGRDAVALLQGRIALKLDGSTLSAFNLL